MAGPFKFRLEVVERLRRLDMQREQRVMAGCVQAVLEARQLAELVAGRMEENARERRGIQQGSRLDVAGLRAEQRHMLWLQRMRDQTAQELSRRQELMEGQRQKLVAASRRVKVIEKLRERQWKRFQDGQRREERKVNDEWAMALPGLVSGHSEWVDAHAT